MFHPYIQDLLWKKFQDWCHPDKRNPILRFPPVEGRVCLYNCSYSSRSLPALQEMLELDCAYQEDTNLKNFFTEYFYVFYVFSEGILDRIESLTLKNPKRSWVVRSAEMNRGQLTSTWPKIKINEQKILSYIMFNPKAGSLNARTEIFNK